MKILNMPFFRDVRDMLRYGLDLDFDQFMVAHGDYSNLCCDFDKNGCPTPAGIRDAQNFVARAENWTSFGWWLYAVWRRLGTIRAAVHCECFGHNWRNEDWGGPEGGGMAASCTRCGYGFEHVLY